MFTGSYLCEILDVDGLPDDEGRVVFALTVAATVRCRVAPLSTAERASVKPVHDVTTAIVVGGSLSVNPKQWCRVFYGHGPITYRIREVRWLGVQQRLLCDLVTTSNADREETFFDLPTDDQTVSALQVAQAQAMHPARLKPS